MKTVALVACARRKLPFPAPARDLYVSDWFRKARAYAEAQADEWYILSARHQLLDPGRVVAPYEMSLRDMDPDYRLSWSHLVAHQLADELTGPTRLVILAGDLYRREMLRFLRPKMTYPLDVVVPMAGLGIGQQLAWLKTKTIIPPADPPAASF